MWLDLRKELPLKEKQNNMLQLGVQTLNVALNVVGVFVFPFVSACTWKESLWCHSCANRLVSLFPLGVKTNSLNKWWLVRSCRGRCMLLDPSCGFAVIAEFKHRFRELKTWVHFSLKGLEICIFRDADISEKKKYSVPECFPRWLMKSFSPRNFCPDEALNIPFGGSWL